MKKIINMYLDSYKGLSKEIWLLSLVMLINRAGTMVIPFIAIFVAEAMGKTMLEAGYVISIFGFGSLVGSFLGGWLTDRLGYHKVQYLSTILGGLMFILLAFIDDYHLFCISMFFLGAIGDAYRPAHFVAVGAYSSKENYTRSLSLIRLAINLGYSAGPAIGGIVIAYLSYDWLFYLDGITCILAGIFIYYILPYKQPEVETTNETKSTNEGPYKDKSYLIFTLASVITAIVFFQLFSTTPLYFREVVHLSEQQIGLLFTLNGLVIFAFEMPIVAWTEKKFNIMNLIILGGILIGLSYIVFLLLQPVLLACVLSILLITFGEVFNFPYGNSWAVHKSNPYTRGQYMGLYTMSFSMAFIVSPLVGTFIANNYGFDSLWYAMAILTILSWLLYLLAEKLLPKKN